ncbi:MAG: AraC family transcriptional regulator [Clostridia bacterium]|nr:AraC family transcriptional regulator [Clostridia bacterium]
MREQILAVQRMQDYIEKNFEKTITMSQLAKVSFFSPWYSYKLFRRYTGLTPSEYVRRMRLSRSAMRLKNDGCRVIDAALDMGYDSVDGYTRAFFKEFGINPKEYAKEKKPITLFIPYGVKFRELRKYNVDMENLQSVFVQIIHKDARKVIIKRGIKAEDYFSYREEVGCDVWGILSGMDSLCKEPVCLWLNEHYKKPGTSTYVQGVEVPFDYNGAIPDGFDIIELPQADYLMFQGEPFEEENYCEAIGAVQHSMERYEPSVIGYEWDNESPRIQLEPIGQRGYIELRGVKKILSR